MARVLTLFGLTVSLLAVPCAGQEPSDEFLVFFLNGTSFCAKGKIEVIGRSVRITRSDGTLVSHPVQQVDLVETERNRQLNFGCAKVIEVGGRARSRMSPPTPTPAIGTRPLLLPGAAAESVETALDTPTQRPEITLRDTPYSDPRVAAAFEQMLEERRIYLYQMSQGSQPDHLFIRATTATQREVFSTLLAVADAYTRVCRADKERAPQAVELEMVRTTGTEAGIFRVSPEMGAALATGQVTVEEFFFNHVIF